MLLRTRNNTALSRFPVAQMYGADNRLGLFIPNLWNLHLCWTKAGQKQIRLLRWGFHTACPLTRQPLSSALPQAWWFACSLCELRQKTKTLLCPVIHKPRVSSAKHYQASCFHNSAHLASGGYGMHPTYNKTKLVLGSFSQDPFASGSSSLHPSSYF